MSARDKITFIPGDATLALYGADASGAPVLSTPLWFGACHGRLRIVEQWIVVETRPGGITRPRRHPLVAQYEIEIERVWTLPRNGLADFRPQRGPYVLDILWEDEESGLWHRKTFYNVTPAARSLEGSAADSPTDDSQTWQCEYYTEASGAGLPAAPSASLPLVVRWVGADGAVDLYDHVPGTWSFVERAGSPTTGRATLVYTPGDQSGVFEVLFASGSTVALRLTAAQILEVGSLIQGAARPVDIPRLDFIIGSARAASVTLAKQLFTFNVNEAAALLGGTSQFQMRGGSTLALVLQHTGAGCVEVRETL